MEKLIFNVFSLNDHHMKHLMLFTCIFLLFASNVHAQPQQKLNIDQATVFLSGAELVSTARLNLLKGENEISFTNVAGDVNDRSITVNATNGVVVEGVTFLNNYLAAEELSPRAKEIKDSITIVTENREMVNNKKSVLGKQVGLLWKAGGDSSKVSAAELTKLIDLVGAKMENLMNQKSKLEEQIKKIDERITKLNKQLEEEQRKGYQPGGQLIVKFYAKEATNSAITINYMVPHAGWRRIYDILADDVHSPIKLFYKANIYQNSGVKWNNVRLTLSTGNPNEGVQAPVMNPWYLAFYMPPVYNAYSKALTRSENATIPMANVSDLVSTAAGVYQSQRGLNQSSIDQYVSVDNAGINTSFDIDLPYTIPSDGQKHLAAIKKYELPATYRYFAIPKLDKDAFLQAQVTNWEDLNLLPGQTNIFYEGTYVGQGNIDVRNVKDTMTLSLGRDKKIIVKRERDVKLRSVRTIGTNVRETFAYNITVRNTRKEPITLILQDQQPVSNDKDIVIEDKETSGAEYDETTGMMKWTLSLGASESKKTAFGYTIKYPKGKTIDNLPR
jgi:uncharacterized protein (TIGR02231 family)